ncbi:CDP-glycerol glycerophosphotransferase family protein [Halobacillus sp. KGW1]|uniref:CDP-glycerol glycerophosphotransferase family protein n=1 Tax=Halobacillus sp. KGW1 TaxID=1793726 RepID=UPI00078183F6|nr:CDP-glycerol glycerophosphotransferase family protein [Halobacillus sp. KGW1]
MNDASRNYWSLYAEFLSAFQSIRYKGFSIPYLCHFRSLNHENTYIWENLPNAAFRKHLSKDVKDRKALQALFDQYKQSHVKKKKSKLFPRMRAPKGKIVLYNAANLLRFPKETMERHFRPDQTVLLQDFPAKKKPKIVKGIPVQGVPSNYLSSYRAPVEASVQVLQKQADKIIQTYSGHPMFNHSSFRVNFHKQLAGIVQRIEEANRFFRKNPVSCIVFASTHYYQSRTIAMVAAEAGIPTVCMQHGIIGDEIGYMPQIADVEGVYGHFESEWFQKIGVKKTAVEIIGHPRFDNLFRRSSLMKSELVNQLKINPGKKTILVIVREDKQVDKWKTLVQNLSKEGNYNIIIKDFLYRGTPHPLTKLSPHIYSSAAIPLYDLIHHSDVVLTYLSTVGLEAMIADKPVFVLSTTFPTYTGYFDRLVPLVDPRPMKVARMVGKYFSDDRWKQQVKETRQAFLNHAYPTAKPSGTRLMDLLRRLSKQGGVPFE